MMAAKTCIGLDIGTSAIKVAQLKVGRGGSVQLLNFGIEPLSPDTIVDGTIMNQQAVVEAIKTLIARLKIKQKEVALAISGHSVIIKKIFVPAMTEDELEEQIPWEAEQHIPFDKNDVEIDHQVLSGKNSQGQMELLLVAAKKDVVRDYTSLAKEAHLHPVIVDIAAFAVQNAFEIAYDAMSPTDTVVIINVGASVSNINIISGGGSAFTRDVTTGGNAFTDEIKRQLNVSHEEAESLKKSASENVLEPAGEGDATSKGPGGPKKRNTGRLFGLPKDADKIMQQTAEQMAGEFSKSLDFFLASHPDTSVSKIYLAGGAARVTTLHHAIAQRAHVPVEVLDVFRKMTIPEGTGPGKFDLAFLKHHAAQAAVAIGLALRAPGDR
ncbi:MAG: type IV pilus assembly protein PilM [Myxococcales bacterium]|nr:type IV pilus assembly protein PilM [Myxococcales bacterium]